LNYEKYKSNALKLGIILGSVRAIGKIDSTIFGGYFENAKNLETINTTQKNTTLASNYNSFHFEYSSPAFGLQNNVEYSYKLDGYDKQWSARTSKTEKDYTNLPSGKYTFQVKAHDNLGNESTTTLYTFSVNPPWYKTVIAYVIYLVLLFLILYSVNNWQKRKLHFQTIKFEEKQKQINTLHQLELEKNEKEIIKLKNEKLEGEILLKTKELADTSMHLVERSDALLKVKEELQKLYKNTNENHDIKKTLTLLNDIEKNDSNWEKFAVHFDEVNNNFLKNLKLRFPKLTNNDLKVCAYLQLNLASKEISQLMNIGVRGVEISRYRLRKKLGLSTEQSLIDFLNESA
jgi:DNA-binding CsgD family transcriptional regulator